MFYKLRCKDVLSKSFNNLEEVRQNIVEFKKMYEDKNSVVEIVCFDEVQKKIDSRMENIKKIYEILDLFKVDCKDCHSCCGQIVFLKTEWDNLPNEIRSIIKIKPQEKEHLVYTFVEEDKKCKLLTENGCSIYNYRPLVCRITGRVNKSRIKCVRGGAKVPDLVSDMFWDCFVRLFNNKDI